MKIYNKYCQINRALNAVSDKIGILSGIGKATRFNNDPKIIAFSAKNCDPKYLNGELYAGKSGGCGYDWEQALLSAVGEYDPYVQERASQPYKPYPGAKKNHLINTKIRNSKLIYSKH